MCALTTTPFQSFEWPLTNLMNQQNNYLITERSFESFSNFDSLQQPQIQLDRSASFTTKGSGHPTMVKKLYHNASERVRRKKINTLYSFLRSLLPAADRSKMYIWMQQMETDNLLTSFMIQKKLSIPATVSRALKYIPELQQQVESLIQKKEELLSRISLSSQKDLIHQEKQRKSLVGGSLFSVSASRLSDSEVMIQISAYKLHNNPLSDILLHLEEDGLFLMEAASFQSSGGRIFYSLHLLVERTCRIKCEVLSEKLLTLYEKKEEVLL